MSSPPGIDKAALLLKKLPGTILDRVLEKLGPERAARVRLRMQSLDDAMGNGVTLESLVNEFESLLAQPTTPTVVGTAPQLALYRRVAEQVADAPPGNRAESRPGPEKELDLSSIDRLYDLPPEILAGALLGEKTQTVAMVLNSLPVEYAGQVLNRLTPELRRDVPVCLSRQSGSNPELLDLICKALLQKARASGSAAAGPSARYEKIAGMLRTLERPDRNDALTALQEQEPDAALRVKELLYQFEDILRIVDRSMQKLLSEVDTKSLAISLKGASEDISDKVLRNLSSRARETLGEEMELLGNVPPAGVRQAQKTVVEVIQRLDSLGELQMEE